MSHTMTDHENWLICDKNPLSEQQSSLDIPCNMTTMPTSVHWQVDDIDEVLAADFDESLSGLGMEIGTSSFNMSEALMALPHLPTLKHEPHHSNSNYHHHHHHHHSLNELQNERITHSEPSSQSLNGSFDRNSNSPLLHNNLDDNKPIAVVHGKKNRLAYGNEDEFVSSAIKRFCLSNDRDSGSPNDNARFLLNNNVFSHDDECNDDCANDIRCQNRHSSSVPDLRIATAVVTNQVHSTASSPSSTGSYTPASSVLSQILASQQIVPSPTSPVAHDSLTTTAIGIKSTSSKFQYVLGAATSMAMKMHEETMTYLNQGQSYEIKLKKLGDLTEMRGKLLKSILRVGFQERRLQYMEKELILQWKQQRPSERILEIDIPLSYGIHDIYNDHKDANKCEFFWDPTKETGVFVRVNCISTEFTPKKHGGEKGVPFRLVIETYPHNGTSPSSCLHAASCQVKVFKPKGADRKHKTDREKMGKRPSQEQEKFQPSYDCTVFTDCPLDSLFSYSSSNNTTQSPTTTSTITIATSSVNTVKPKKTPLNIEKSIYKSVSSPILGTEGMLDLSSSSTTVSSSPQSNAPLSSDSDANHTSKWLNQNRFANYARTFSNFSGTDILRLTREDLIQICGLTDGIRLYNSLHSRSLPPRLTIYICLHTDEVFRAVYLENLTLSELNSKLSSILLGTNAITIKRLYMIRASGIKVLVTDEVVRNITDETMFIAELSKDSIGDTVNAILKPFSN